MTTTDPTPTLHPDRAMTDAARREAHAALSRVVAAADPDAFAVEPMFPGAQSTTRAPLPVPALRAALLLSRLFTAEARRQVRRAREAGVSWADLAPALDMEDGGAAFEWATGGVEDSWRRSSVPYRCPSCAELIADYGPYENHPEDNESGHAPGCARHMAALLTWSATNDDDPASDYPDDDPDDADGQPADGQPAELTGRLVNVVGHVNRCGYPWADADLEADRDGDGRGWVVGVRVFPQLYQEVAALVRQGTAVTVSGRVDRRDGAAVVIAARLTGAGA